MRSVGGRGIGKHCYPESEEIQKMFGWQGLPTAAACNSTSAVVSVWLWFLVDRDISGDAKQICASRKVVCLAASARGRTPWLGEAGHIWPALPLAADCCNETQNRLPVRGDLHRANESESTADSASEQTKFALRCPPSSTHSALPQPSYHVVPPRRIDHGDSCGRLGQRQIRISRPLRQPH